MTWQDRRILVTGAGGFIGSHLCERLVAEGARVRAFIRYTSTDREGLLRLLPSECRSRLEVRAGDLRDPEAVAGAAEGAEVVFHLGALISIPYSYRHPYEVAETNILGTLNVLNACRRHGVGRLVHTSTSEVYGTAVTVPIEESHPLQPQSPYSASKIGADALAESYYRSFDLPVVILRPFNTFGPRQSARAIIPTIIVQSLAGDVVRLGDLRPKRDFTYVEDTVKAFLLAADAQAALGHVTHVGTGRAVSVGEVAEIIFNVIGKKPEIVTEQQRLRPELSEVMLLQADGKLAKERMGWVPDVALEDGVRRTVAWIAEHRDLYRPEVYEV